MIPKLRFPEFTDKWHKKTVSDLVSNTSGTALEEFVNNNERYRFISIGNYSTEGLYIDNAQRIGLNEKTRQKLLEKGNLVMVLNDKTAHGDLIGSTILVDSNDLYIYNQRSERLIAKKGYHPQYLWFLFNLEKFRKQIVSISQGGTQIYVNFPFVKKIVTIVPNYKEQQKIADFLTTIDKKIETNKKKIELLKRYKKGIMQKITQQIWFKDGEMWRNRTLGELVAIPISDGPHLTPTFVKSGVLFLSVDNLQSGSIKIKNPRRISLNDHEEYSKKCRPKNGDILFGKAASVGNVAIADLDEPFNVWSPIAVIRINNAIADTRFIYYALQTSILKKQVRRFINSSSQENIGMSDINKLLIKTPPSSTQKQIADFLSSIDDKIKAEETKLASAKKFKKALLQRMFV